jgi:hypothetical protein
MKVWLFTCKNDECEQKDLEVRLVEVINPVMCGGCFESADATETDEEIDF